MIRFPEVRALARTLAAVVLSAAALGASPAAAATITISDTAFSGNQTVCPRDNVAAATPITVNAFQVIADAAATVDRVQVRILPAGAYVNLERIEIRSADLATLYGSALPSGDLMYVNLATPLPAGTTAASYRISIVPRRYADMPPPGAGKAFAIQAQLVLAQSAGNTVVGNDLASATVTVDNSAPANITWAGVTSGASVTLNWSAAASVVVLRREFAPVFDAAVAGSTYVANTSAGTSQVVFVGSAASYDDTTVQTNRSYYYKVFTRAPVCTTYSSGAEIGPILAGGTAEGDATNDTTKPVIGIVSPGNGPVTRPFKVKIRVFSPATLPITEVRLYGNNSGTDTLLGSSVGAGALITRNANYDGGSPADPASGFYEFTAPAGFAAGNWTLRAWAANVASPTLAQGSYSGPIGVSVGTSVGDGKLLVRDNSSQFCADCHKEQTHSAETVGTGHGSWYVGCRGCHDPHGTTNAKLIAKQVTPPAYAGAQAPQSVYYTGATGNVNGGKVNPTGTGLCQACHTRTSVFTRGSTADFSAHDNGQPCATCHKHDKGLGASCSSCHGDPTRNVAGGDSMQAAAPPRGAPPGYATSGNAVGKHLVHVTSSTFRAALTCANCHQTPNAHNGTVDAPTFPARGNIPQAGVWSAAASTCASTYCHAGPATRTFAGNDRTPNWLTSPAVDCQSCHQSPPTTAASYGHSASDTDCTICHPAGYSLSGLSASARLTHIDGNLDVVAGGCTGCHGTTGVNAAPPARATISGVNATTSPLANAVGAHQGHVTKSNFLPAPLACSDCHNSYPTGHRTDSQGTVAWSALANNGGAMTASYAGGATPTCTVYCHAGSVGGTPGGMTPNWATGAAMDCASCHGNPPVHPHPGNTTCADCHPSSGGETYSRTSATAGTVVKATHINRTVNRTTSACTSCHGTLTASGVTLLTNTAQSAPGYDTTGSEDTFGGNTSASPGVGAHRTHLTATRMRPGGAAVCTDCHVLPPTDNDTAHAQDAGTGGARAAVRFLNTGGLTGTYSGSTSGADGSTAGNCSATYCHGGKFTTAPYQGSTPAPNWSGTAMNCGSCHLFPPTTHTFVSTTTQCGSCHTGWTTCTTANQATCVAPTTHIDPTAPQATTTCTSCHGGTSGNAAPPEAAIKSPVGPNAVGAHQSHVTGGNIRTAMACTECHQSVTALNSTNHYNGTVNTQFTTALSTGTAWSSTAPSSCATSYCHGGAASQTQWGRALGNPQWNTVDGTYQACNACHGSPPNLNAATHHPPTTLACTVCHAGYTAPNITDATALSQHVDGSIQYRAGCTGCHGDVTQTGVANTSNLAAPGINANARDISGAASGTPTGAHAAHLNGMRLRTTLLACSECHPIPGPGDMTHADGAGNSTGARANVSMPGTLANGTVAGGANTNPGYSSPTCSNVYCHGSRYVGRAGYTGTNSGSPLWTQTTAQAAACGTCHAAAPTAGTTHTNANAGTEACTQCHTTYLTCTKADNFATCQLPVEHINGQFDGVSGGCGMCHGNPPATVTLTAPFVGATHPQNPTCGNCHGAGYNTTDYASLPGTHGGTTVPGTDAPNNGCTACHGVLAGPTAAGVTVNTAASNAPGYWVSGTTFGVDSAGSTATSYTAVGAHDAHVRKTNLRSAALECTQCHYGLLPASGNVSHSNGNAQTAFDPALAASSGPVTWTRSAATCAATYCHGNFPNGNDRISGGTPTTPGQVTGLASPSQTNRSISLSWTAVTGAVLYKIERSDTVIGGPYVQIGTSATNTYVDDGLWDTRTYYYRVRAWNTAATGDGAYSSPSLTQATTGSGGGSPATVTYNWQIASGAGPNNVTYNWTTACGAQPSLAALTTTYTSMTTAAMACASDRLINTATNAAAFEMLTLVSPAYAAERAISAGSFTVSIRNATGTANMIFGFQLGTVRAGAWTWFGTEVQATATGGANTVVTPNLSGQTGTVLQNGSLVLRIRKITATTDDARINLGGTNGVLTVTETPTGTAPTLPAVPTGVAANFRVTGTTQNTVSLAWDPVANTSTYHVERGPTQTGAWTQVAEVAAGTIATTVLTDRALTASNTYYYRAIASNPAGNSSGGYTTNTVSGTTSAAAAAGAVSWTGSFVPGSSSLTCTSCHGNPPGGTHPTGANDCSRCHDGFSDNTANPQTVDKAVHMDGTIDVNCIGCHTTTQGTRSAVVGEFAMAWSHKASATVPGSVTKWDCIVCHMEGNPSTGDRDWGHGDGMIQLRDPDSGTTILAVTFTAASGTNPGSYATGAAFGFAKFSRNLSVNLENDTNGAIPRAIMISQCLKCHDANGAQAYNGGRPLGAMATQGGLTRTAGHPFGTTITRNTNYNGGTGLTACASGDNGCVTNIDASFVTTNSSYHPIKGKNDNWYARANRMNTPWNLARTPATVPAYTSPSWGTLMSCWDCHAPNGTASTQTLTRTITAHGGATTVRGTTGVNGSTLCVLCHIANVGAVTNGQHGTNSAFASSTNNSMQTYINANCQYCHASATTKPARPIAAQDVHGVSTFPAGGMAKTGRWAIAGEKPYAFIRNTVQLTNHSPARIQAATTWGGQAGARCAGNNGASCSNAMGTYTPGGTY